jgi:hypothetical protein
MYVLMMNVYIAIKRGQGKTSFPEIDPLPAENIQYLTFFT